MHCSTGLAKVQMLAKRQIHSERVNIHVLESRPELLPEPANPSNKGDAEADKEQAEFEGR